VKTLQELVDLFDGCDQDVIAVRRESLVQAVRQLGEQQAMMTAFRHAANSIGLATGVVAQHVDHDEAAKSVTGDHYFLEQIAESELRYKRLEAVAATVVTECEWAVISVEEELGHEGWFNGSFRGVADMREILGDATPSRGTLVNIDPAKGFSLVDSGELARLKADELRYKRLKAAAEDVVNMYVGTENDNVDDLKEALK
jgi:hypothetical protein